jgi:hypothetical protein
MIYFQRKQFNLPYVGEVHFEIARNSSSSLHRLHFR